MFADRPFGRSCRSKPEDGCDLDLEAAGDKGKRHFGMYSPGLERAQRQRCQRWRRGRAEQQHGQEAGEYAHRQFSPRGEPPYQARCLTDVQP
jgi:hypothetical protein